ncbi:MAG: hypothetical protein WC683_01015 [bacterium]
MIYLVCGPEGGHICGYALAKDEALAIARELNGMLDDLDDGSEEDAKRGHYYVSEVRFAVEHLADCKASGFPF